MEQIEEKWREDYDELLTTVSRLQDDNRKLTESLQAAEKDKIVNPTSNFFFSFIFGFYLLVIFILAQVLSPDVDTVALQRLRHTVDQMRDNIRSYEHQLNSKSNEVDSVSRQYCNELLYRTLNNSGQLHS